MSEEISREEIAALLARGTVVKQESCEDAISRQAAIDACNQSINMFEATDRIEDLPSVHAEPRTGHWEPTGYDGYADGYPVVDEWECSECGYEHYGDDDTLTAFCPNCGAKMVEPQESEEQA